MGRALGFRSGEDLNWTVTLGPLSDRLRDAQVL